MTLTIEFNEGEERVLEALAGTTQWGESAGDVAKRLMLQRIWQLSGDALTSSHIGQVEAERAANQITRPGGE